MHDIQSNISRVAKKARSTIELLSPLKQVYFYIYLISEITHGCTLTLFSTITIYYWYLMQQVYYNSFRYFLSILYLCQVKEENTTLHFSLRIDCKMGLMLFWSKIFIFHPKVHMCVENCISVFRSVYKLVWPLHQLIIKKCKAHLHPLLHSLSAINSKLTLYFPVPFSHVITQQIPQCYLKLTY